MAITRNFKHSIAERAGRDPAFAKAMLDEAATLFLNDEPEVARSILRDLVNATVGFEALAAKTGTPSKSLHRMLSASGNPTMDNLAGIFGAIRKSLKVDLRVRATRAARAMNSATLVQKLWNYCNILRDDGLSYGDYPGSESGAGLSS